MLALPGPRRPHGPVKDSQQSRSSSARVRRRPRRRHDGAEGCLDTLASSVGAAPALGSAERRDSASASPCARMSARIRIMPPPEPLICQCSRIVGAIGLDKVQRLADHRWMIRTLRRIIGAETNAPEQDRRARAGTSDPRPATGPRGKSASRDPRPRATRASPASRRPGSPSPGSASGESRVLVACSHHFIRLIQAMCSIGSDQVPVL